MDRGAWRATVHGVAKSWTRWATNIFTPAQFTAGPYLFSSQELGRISVPLSEHVPRSQPDPFSSPLGVNTHIVSSSPKLSRTLCSAVWEPLAWNPSGSSVHGIFQARILKWAAISRPRRFCRPRDRTRAFCIFCTAGQLLTAEPEGTNLTAASRHFRPAPPLSTFGVRSSPRPSALPALPLPSLPFLHFPFVPRVAALDAWRASLSACVAAHAGAGTHQRTDLPLEGLLLSQRDHQGRSFRDRGFAYRPELAAKMSTAHNVGGATPRGFLGVVVQMDALTQFAGGWQAPLCGARARRVSVARNLRPSGAVFQCCFAGSAQLRPLPRQSQEPRASLVCRPPAVGPLGQWIGDSGPIGARGGATPSGRLRAG